MPGGNELSYTLDDHPDEESLRCILTGLDASNAGHLDDEDRRPLAAFVREGGRIVGGVDGHTRWQWLYVSHLWVEERLRGRGVGRRLMTLVESEAIQRGCGGSWLDTFSFQVPQFYEALGYQQFGELRDFPPGSNRIYLRKHLDV